MKSYNWNNNKSINESRSFSILNCTELESIEIGACSFSDYGGGFELKNLPKLYSIIIGRILEIQKPEILLSGQSWSINFYCCSFMIESILCI